jgi:ankyrin repeat protein
LNYWPLIIETEIIKISEYSLPINSTLLSNDMVYRNTVVDTIFSLVNNIYKNNIIDTLHVGSIIKIRTESKKVSNLNFKGDIRNNTGPFICGLNFSNIDSNLLSGSSVGLYNVESKYSDSIENLIDKILSHNNSNQKLLKAIELNNFDSVKRLIDEGAKINSNSDYDYFEYHWTSPLFKAIEIGNIEITEYLLKNGGNPKALNHLGKDIYYHVDNCKIFNFNVLNNNFHTAQDAT